jgi:Zn-dependent protease
MLGYTFEDLVVVAIVLAVMLLVAFPVHEASHAFAAWRLGDGTAKLFGRLTLDPRAHFDRMGGVLLVLTVVLSGGSSGFGWAKPTPVNPMHLRGGRSGEAIVAAAGPISNLALAIAGALLLRLELAIGVQAQIPLLATYSFTGINLVLMVFNLVPIPPLDGSKVLYAALDPRTLWRVRPMLEQYGTLVFLVAVFFPIFGGRTLLEVLFTTIVSPLLALLTGVSVS